MSGLEVVGVAFGAPGILPLVGKAIDIWKGLAEMKPFGSDIAETVAKFTMEFYRFDSWVRVVLSSADGSEQSEECLPVGAPIEDAITSILTALAEVEKILQQYKLNPDAASTELEPPIDTPPAEPAPPENTPNNTASTFSWSSISSFLRERKKVEDKLQNDTSLRKRLTYASKAWGVADKDSLEAKIKDLRYWNNRLQGLLPTTVRSSINQQAVPGRMLQADDNQEILAILMKAAETDNEAVRIAALLWQEKRKFENADSQDANIDTLEAIAKYEKPASAVLGIEDLRKRVQDTDQKFNMCMFEQTDTEPPVPAVMERYNAPVSHLMASRLALLVHLGSNPSIPRSLLMLKPLAFIKVNGSRTSRARSDKISLVYTVPPNATPAKPPVSLDYILKAEDNDLPHRPSLEKRLNLARQLASAVFAYGLIRWFHKDLNAKNVIFFYSSNNTGDIIISSPYIVGLSMSRPGTLSHLSEDSDYAPGDLHIHPALQDRGSTSYGDRPRYCRKFDIWSLAILLIEIGFWLPIDRVGSKASRPEYFESAADAYQIGFLDEVEKIRNHARKDLPFHVGDKYCDIVEKCFEIATEEDEGADDNLMIFYWDVVYELAKLCR
ncbi:hypothetical protein TWF281_003699 [Arthrobotrys megalospora]